MKKLAIPSSTAMTGTSTTSSNPNSLTGSQVNDLVEGADGFAEVFPQHKYMVVDILQKRGHIVAMTGDGVNDAPSLKKADTGIAVEGATQAARAAADIVFLNAGLSAIIDALKTSRRIFHRMRAYVVYRIALSLHLELFLTSMIIVTGSVINSELIVFLAIFADLATLAIAYDSATFSAQPTKWRITNLWGTAIILGLVLLGGTWLIFATTMVPTGLLSGFSGDAQGVLFLEISLTQNWLIFITRCDGSFWVSRPSILLVLAVLMVDIIATLFVVFGVFLPSRTSLIVVLKVWVFSIGIFVILAIFHQSLNKSQFFEKFIRYLRNPIGEHYSKEDLMYNLEKIAFLHEKQNGGPPGSSNKRIHDGN